MAIRLTPCPRLVYASLLIAHLILAGQSVPARAATTVSTVSNPFSLHGTNGNKVVVGLRNVLHAVYISGGHVFYTQSADGVAWSTPLSVGARAGLKAATIAVTRKDTVGIAYTAGDGIYYTYRTPTADWRLQPIKLSDFGQDLSMVSYDLNMHLVWSAESIVSYLSFPAVITSKPSGEEKVNMLVLCGTTRVSMPSIAVIPSATSSKPLARVAWFHVYLHDSMTPQCTPDSFGFMVAQRPENPKQFEPWTLIFGGSSPADVSNTGAVAMSLAANPRTGDFYLGVSKVFNSVESTTLYYENAWEPGLLWRSHPLLDRRAVIDVAADGCSEFRIAVSDITKGLDGGYSPTWYRTGKWDMKAAAPTWQEPVDVQVSGSARDAQAVFWKKAVRETNSTRHVHALFDEKSGSLYSIKHDDLTMPGFPLFPNPLACLDRSEINQAPYPRGREWEMSVLFTAFDLGIDRTIQTGVGGRFGFNAMRNVALEAEVSHLPERTGGPGRLSGGSVTQGFFGLKAGKRFDRWGVFGKARPGFVSFSRTVQEARFDGPFLVGLQLGRATHFAVDVGGGFEVYPSRGTSLRFDFGDTVIPRGDRTNLAPAGGLRPTIPQQRVTTSLPTLSRHNFQFTTGVGFRF